jgi:hypothetical protein
MGPFVASSVYNFLSAATGFFLHLTFAIPSDIMGNQCGNHLIKAFGHEVFSFA